MKLPPLSVIFLIIAIIYAIYLFRLKKGPKDREPEYDKDGPGYFNLGTIGKKPLPRLNSTSRLGEIPDGQLDRASRANFYRRGS